MTPLPMDGDPVFNIEIPLLGLLPLISLLSIVILLRGSFPQWGFRRTFLRSFLLATAYAVLATEALSLFEVLTAPALIAVWSLAPVTILGWLWRSNHVSWLLPRVDLPRFTWTDWVMILAICIVLLTTGLVAWFSPPNTWDALTTHMSRVAHWAQDRSLKPFATGIPPQNYYPPLPGIMVLQTYVLGRGDRLANFIEWFSMVVSLVGISVVVKDLGGSQTLQLTAMVFAATLPSGIVQASSTMTDYIVAAVITCVASETIYHSMHKSSWWTMTFLGISAGLAILSKPTSYAYLIPFALGNLMILLKQGRPRPIIARLLVVIGIVAVLNAGYFARNIAVFGHPLGAKERVALHSNEIGGWRVLVSNTLRNASLHVRTPFSVFNEWVYGLLQKVHVKLGLELADPRTSIHGIFNIGPPSTDEALASNPIHALLIVVASMATFLSPRRFGIVMSLYTVAVLFTFVLLSGLFKFSIFGSRYHLPFFLLFSTVVALALGSKLPRPAAALGSIVLLWFARPWIASIASRPLLPISGHTNLPSVLTAPRETMYVGNGDLYNAYVASTRAIRERQCQNVYLMLSGNQAEYPLWHFLGAPRSSIKIEWNIAGDPSARYMKPLFEPCAVVCDQSCEPNVNQIRGLPLFIEEGQIRLFLKPSHTGAELEASP